MELPELKGYLRKKSRQDRWQRRYFEATTHYLTYYKVSHHAVLDFLEGDDNRESEKLLACIDLWRTQNIELNAEDPAKTEFSIGIGEQSYLLKAETADEAQRWIKGLRARQHRPEGAPSEVFSLRSERYDAESDASSEYGGGRRPGYASSDTGSHGNDRKSKHQQQHHTLHTDSSLNPIVPNANAIAATNKYPMLKTDQSVQQKVSNNDEDNVTAGCCTPACKSM